MAEIVLTAVINKATELAGNALFQEGSDLHSLEENILWLQREMRHIRSYIDDAKAKMTEGNSKVKNLIQDIEELGGDAEDMLDEFSTNFESHSQTSKGAIGWLKVSIAFFSSHASAAHKFSTEVEKIKTRVAEIDHVRTTYGITDIRNSNDQRDFVPLDRKRLFLYTDETEVIGLDDDFNMLHAKVLDQDIRYGVISIVGMAGLGKTTLAKKLYRHVRDKFECSALVYASQQPRFGEIVLDIAKQVGLSEEERQDNLENKLRSLLKRKRYVILIDDIWNVEIWADLKHILPEHDSKFGSRMIITSRNTNVGRYIGGDNSLHMLQPLDSGKSFELFTKSIFAFDNSYWENAPPNLENIGKEIVERCGGIPLAIVLIAGMLRARERTKRTWGGVLATMSHNIQDQCAKILVLSYNDLPAMVRPCFLYFGIFPEDCEIRAFDLTKMWVAEKFIVAGSGIRREVEDIAEDVLNDLVSRNLIQVSRRTFEGRIASCRIHDLLHDLCVTLAKEANFCLTKDETSGDLGIVTKHRRLALCSGGGGKFISSHPNSKKLRALFYFNNIYTPLRSHRNFKLLRVLYVHESYSYYTRVVRIPKGIGRLSCLVYLKLKGYKLGGSMPHNILKLKHLMTLDIRKTCIHITSNIMEMKQLRHLCLSRYGSFVHKSAFPSSTNASNLQTLIWADGNYMNPRWFHGWTNLRRLSLSANRYFLKEVFSTHAALLPKLEILKLIILEGFQQNNLSSYDNFLDLSSYDNFLNLSSYDNLLKLNLSYHSMFYNDNFRIVLPTNLIKFTLSARGEYMNQFSTVIKRMPKLKILKLRRCWISHDYVIDLSGADKFPQLEELLIFGGSGLQEVTVDDLGAPKLNKVILSDCYRESVRLSERLKSLTVYVKYSYL